MSIQAITWVFQKSKSTGSAARCPHAIAYHIHNDGTGAWPAQETLAAESGRDLRTVRRAIDVLVGLGELHVDEYQGPPANGPGRHTHRYTMPVYADTVSAKKKSLGGHDGRLAGQPDLSMRSQCPGNRNEPTEPNDDDHPDSKSETETAVVAELVRISHGKPATATAAFKKYHPTLAGLERVEHDQDWGGHVYDLAEAATSEPKPWSPHDQETSRTCDNCGEVRWRYGQGFITCACRYDEHGALANT